MKPTSKRATLRSLKRILRDLMDRHEWRLQYAPLGSPEMGVAIGLEDGVNVVAAEIRRIKKLKGS